MITLGSEVLFQLSTSAYAMEEAWRNLEGKAPDCLSRFRQQVSATRLLADNDVPAHCTPEAVGVIHPEWIFALHWSQLIPESIWGPCPTVIFHMTDLLHGRGGRPLQNLIQRGHCSTMLTALPCGAGTDRFKAFRGIELPAALLGVS